MKFIIRQTKQGFTIIELLIVIVILGIIAALTVPAIKNLGKSTTSLNGGMQLKQDLNYARELAMAHGTSVYVVFCPTNFQFYSQNNWLNLTTNILPFQYCLIEYGKVSDQPYQHFYHQLSDWKQLPQNIIIHPTLFSGNTLNMPIWQADLGMSPIQPLTQLSINYPSPFLTNSITLPSVGYNWKGQPINGQSIYIPVVNGYVQNNTTVNVNSDSTNTAYSVIAIDRYTGLSVVEIKNIP